MNTSIVNTTCNALSVVDMVAIICTIVYFNRRVTALEKERFIPRGSGIGKASAAIPETKIPTGIEDRVITLENEIEVLLQRLQAYDQLFMRMMTKMKEQAPVIEKVTEMIPSHIVHFTDVKKDIVRDSSPKRTSPVRRTAIRRRAESPEIDHDSGFARKELFVDAIIVEEVDTSSPEVDDDAEFAELGPDVISETSDSKSAIKGRGVSDYTEEASSIEDEDEQFSFLKD